MKIGSFSDDRAAVAKASQTASRFPAHRPWPIGAMQFEEKRLPGYGQEHRFLVCRFRLLESARRRGVVYLSLDGPKLPASTREFLSSLLGTADVKSDIEYLNDCTKSRMFEATFADRSVAGLRQPIVKIKPVVPRAVSRSSRHARVKTRHYVLWLDLDAKKVEARRAGHSRALWEDDFPARNTSTNKLLLWLAGQHAMVHTITPELYSNEIWPRTPRLPPKINTLRNVIEEFKTFINKDQNAPLSEWCVKRRGDAFEIRLLVTRKSPRRTSVATVNTDEW